MKTSPQLQPEDRQVLLRMADCVGIDPDRVFEDDALIGFFQSFRPDGRGLDGLFDGLENGSGLAVRLESLFAVAGDDRRPSGGRDAYFVVRRPSAVEPTVVEDAGKRLVSNLLEMAGAIGDERAKDQLAGVNRVRVLEGTPPKHPKHDIDKTDLLRLFQDGIPTWTQRMSPSPSFTELLQPAYYFVSCDRMLADHLMWPLFESAWEIREPFSCYFQLWQHGVKWRIFQEQQIDLYMPRIEGLS